MRERTRQTARIASLAIAGLLLGAASAQAYPFYDDPSPSSPGNDMCSACHNGFKSAGALHQAHLSGLQINGSPGVITTNCNVCHSDGGGSVPVVTYGSNNVQGNGFGCAGCHGQNYGETVMRAPVMGDPDFGAKYTYTGDAKASGYGLRLVHAAAGVTECAGCHAPNPFTPLTEQVAPPYYTMGVSKLANPCDSNQEDLPYDMDGVGLDNDGNGFSDYPADMNCAATTTTTTTTSTTTTTLPATCGPAPAVGCIGAEKAKLQIDSKTAGKEKMKFQLTKLVSNTVQSDFGNPIPVTGTSYAICIYDQANALVGSYEVDRAGEVCGDGFCWEDSKGTAWKYDDKTAQAADGIVKMQLSSGVAGKGKVKVQGKNDTSNLPTGIPALLSGDTAATAQLITNNAECFGMALPTVKKNDGLVFQAQAP